MYISCEWQLVHTKFVYSDLHIVKTAPASTAWAWGVCYGDLGWGAVVAASVVVVVPRPGSSLLSIMHLCHPGIRREKDLSIYL